MSVGESRHCVIFVDTSAEATLVLLVEPVADVEPLAVEVSFDATAPVEVEVVALPEAVSFAAKPLVLPVSLVLPVALVLALFVEASLLATAPLEVEVVALPDEVSFAAKPLVLPVALSDVLELLEGEEAAPALLVEVSLLATAPVEVEVVALPEDVSFAAKPLVLPVWLMELLAALDGDDVADAFALFADVSLLATALLEVEAVALADEVSLDATLLVLPVSPMELLLALEGDDVADAFALFADVSLLATAPLLEVALFAVPFSDVL